MKKVLTVDDSRTIREMVAFTLRGAGYEVYEAENGVKGIEMLQKEAIDLVIADINMPEMDGITMIRTIRGDNQFKKMPILVLTTEGDERRKNEGREAGATGWIVKPFAPDRLVEVVRKVCP